VSALGQHGFRVAECCLYQGDRDSSWSSLCGGFWRFHLHDAVTGQSGAHRVRFGVDWEYNRGGLVQWINEPATLTLYTPQQARENNIPVPAVFGRWTIFFNCRSKRYPLPSAIRDFHSLDLRLTRSFVLRERYKLALIGEVFNAYNTANLSGFSGNLMMSGFGEPRAV
jgi:hypothetical protein